ncbi:hypothetical protein NMY22_g14789 [Coprinellus aureogranulatus]|nr:hypothetical protein NMY22_g14789 [Coprinellus aureogranulatus]
MSHMILSTNSLNYPTSILVGHHYQPYPPSGSATTSSSSRSASSSSSASASAASSSFSGASPSSGSTQRKGLIDINIEIIISGSPTAPDGTAVPVAQWLQGMCGEKQSPLSSTDDSFCSRIQLAYANGYRLATDHTPAYLQEHPCTLYFHRCRNKHGSFTPLWPIEEPMESLSYKMLLDHAKKFPTIILDSGESVKLMVVGPLTQPVIGSINGSEMHYCLATRLWYSMPTPDEQEGLGDVPECEPWCIGEEGGDNDNMVINQQPFNAASPTADSGIAAPLMIDVPLLGEVWGQGLLDGFLILNNCNSAYIQEGQLQKLEVDGFILRQCLIWGSDILPVGPSTLATLFGHPDLFSNPKFAQHVLPEAYAWSTTWPPTIQDDGSSTFTHFGQDPFNLLAESNVLDQAPGNVPQNIPEAVYPQVGADLKRFLYYGVPAIHQPSMPSVADLNHPACQALCRGFYRTGADLIDMDAVLNVLAVDVNIPSLIVMLCKGRKVCRPLDVTNITTNDIPTEDSFNKQMENLPTHR